MEECYVFLLHLDNNSMPFEDLIQPAINLARNGFIVTENQAKSLNSYQKDFISLRDIITSLLPVIHKHTNFEHQVLEDLFTN